MLRRTLLEQLSGVSAALGVVLAHGQITASIDKLDSTDGLPLPPRNLVVIDVAVDVGPNDAFANFGVLLEIPNGAEIVYAHDENGAVITTAPGTENRFVTFFSRPRLRNGDGRFGPASAIIVGGPRCGDGGLALGATLLDALSGELNYERGRDGYVFRLTLDLSRVTFPSLRCDSAGIVMSLTPLPDAVPLCETTCHGFDAGAAAASQLVQDHLFGFGVYGIPCPGDVNGDGTRDIDDLAQFLSAFGEPNQPCADFDGDDDVDLEDLGEFLANFGLPCPAVP